LFAAALIGTLLVPGREALAVEDAEAAMLRTIGRAGASSSISDLTAAVRSAARCCTRSAAVSLALTQWLRESHPIHAGRRPTEVNQFRGFLLASLRAFPPNDALYGYVRSELLFAAHPYGIAAAAVAARSFPARAGELLPLMEPFLGNQFDDRRVDLTTPELRYPPGHPTRARHEILRTLVEWGPQAGRTLPLLDAITTCPHCGTWGRDAELAGLAAEAAVQIRREMEPLHAGETHAAATPPRLQIIPEPNRRSLSAGAMRLRDQNGRALTFGDLRGRPFVLAFFYTQCAIASKCVSTVGRLRDLASECAKDGLLDRVGIYGMTFDPQFDSPSVLHKYGQSYGLEFGRHVRLLRSEEELSQAFRDDLQLRVGYGAGTVNQHGMQLFVFDRRGRLAAVHDNELWTPSDARSCLARLAAE
jgi:protein SCO1/2